jgi:hypothetical protein
MSEGRGGCSARVLARRHDVDAGMSRYLVDRIEGTHASTYTGTRIFGRHPARRDPTPLS